MYSKKLYFLSSSVLHYFASLSLDKKSCALLMLVCWIFKMFSDFWEKGIGLIIGLSSFIYRVIHTNV